MNEKDRDFLEVAKAQISATEYLNHINTINGGAVSSDGFRLHFIASGFLTSRKLPEKGIGAFDNILNKPNEVDSSENVFSEPLTLADRDAIGFNKKFLLDALKGMDDDEIFVLPTGKESALYIFDKNKIAVIMPMYIVPNYPYKARQVVDVEEASDNESPFG